jgi:hypothetical protein
MGHANLLNISKVVNKKLRERPHTIREIVDYLEAHKMTVNASEGKYDERCMLSYATEQVFGFLLEEKRIKPVGMTLEQRKIFKHWHTDMMWNWDSGNDGESGEYGILDSIQWKAKTKWLPLLKYVSN